MVLLAIDDETTWPAWLVEALNNEFHTLRGFEEVRRSREAESTSWSDRWQQAPNEHANARLKILADFAKRLTGSTFRGYHCTRLLSHEIDVIRQHGLRLLSEALVLEKVNHAEQRGHLGRELAELLRASHLAHDRGPGKRLSMIWFIFDRDGLRTDMSGLWRFFTYWGGEAIYGNVHEQHETASAVLRTLGEPVVVECAVPSGNQRSWRAPQAS